MAVGIQYGVGGAYTDEFSAHKVVRFDETAVAVGVSAVAVPGTAIEAQGTDEAFAYFITTDATAGVLTVNLEHADLLAGPYTVVNECALIPGGDICDVPQSPLVLDMSLVENQGTLMVWISPNGQENLNGVLVDEVKLAHRLAYTTDAAYNGTAINEIGIGAGLHKMPVTGN